MKVGDVLIMKEKQDFSLIFILRVSFNMRQDTLPTTAMIVKFFPSFIRLPLVLRLGSVGIEA